MYSLVKPNRMEVLMKGDANVGIKSLQLRMMENKWTEERKEEDQSTVSVFYLFIFDFAQSQMAVF
jgi:hypothetical protein